ncbi:pectin lyase-like protein [Polyplosphaeria fusca]|uniref:galacturonan 1,4-alpha-galacturonidase n=1 Tax=Polyplosphaeria fusca TaxID=682080 RepID=A0A9P4V1B9_9PLEO|nr:pectin lyase-like protein [Polyplosphaeria fusca]
MRISSHVAIALLRASTALAEPLSPFLQDLEPPVSRGVPCKPSVRPSYRISPKHPGGSFPVSPDRNRTCCVESHGGGKDDSEYILTAIKDCNNGGHVVFSANTQYMISTALDLTFLKNIDLDIQGQILFSNDTNYWQKNSFKHVFQNASTFFQLGGEDVNVYGGGTLDGNGQVWYDLHAKDIYTLRPILFGTINLHNGTISDLNLRHSPQWYNFIANSTNLIYTNISIAGKSTSKNKAGNTDGWDTYRSSNLVIQNSHIDNGDDCVSFKPNSSDIVVQNLVCTGSHGISVGSLGQYIGETDIVRNIHVHNISMSHASSGARIKVWPGTPSALSGDLQGGGGSGAVANITFDGMVLQDVDYAVDISQCYGQKNLTLCREFPANLTIEDVHVRNFRGLTSRKYDPVVGYLVCSSAKACKDIYVENMDVKSPSGKSLYTCGSIPGIEKQVNCTSMDKGLE